MDTIKNIDIIIISMIICATIIALAAIYFNHLFEKKAIEAIEAKGAKEAIDNFQSKKMIKIHRNYIAGFLGFAIIMLISSQYADCDELLKYLSFASTITSFVLSILAIFVTVQSSSDLYKQFARIEEATTTIKTLSGTIEKNAPTISEAATDIKDTSKTLLKKLDEVVNQINEKVNTSLAKTVDQIANMLDSSNEGSAPHEQPQNLTDTVSLDTLKKYFLSNASLNGLLGIYTSALSFEKGKPVILSFFGEYIEYTRGFLLATKATNLIRFTGNLKIPNTTRCVDSQFTTKEIRNAIKENIENIKSTYPESLTNEAKDYVLNKINAIHEHFDVPTISSIDEL